MRKKHNWPLTIFIGGAVGATAWFAYQKLYGLPEIADPWAGPPARQATVASPTAGIAFAGLGCGCTGMPIRGF